MSSKNALERFKDGYSYYVSYSPALENGGRFDYATAMSRLVSVAAQQGNGTHEVTMHLGRHIMDDDSENFVFTVDINITQGKK